MRKLVLLLLLSIAVFVVYAPAVQNEFVWDDTALIQRDPFIRSWRLIPEGFQHFLFADATASDFYRPVQRLAYTLEYAAFAFYPTGYHVVSIVSHLAAAVALFFFATELLRSLGVAEQTRRYVPFVVTLIWAVHPIHTSAVAYISGRADPLAAAFGFLGLYLVLRSWRGSGLANWSWMIAAGVAFLLSSLSKEAGLIFLALSLTIPAVQKNSKAVLRASVIVVFVLVTYLSLRLPAEHTPPPPPAHPVPLLVRPILAARAFAEYSWLLVWPVHLQMDRDIETRPTGFGPPSIKAASWRELETLAGVTLMGAFLYWIYGERKRDRAVFLSLLLTLISYLPVSGLIPLNASIAEHWLYLPSAFLFLALGLTMARCVESRSVRYRFLRPLLALVVAVWIVFLGGRTFLRSFDWQNQRVFLDRTIANGGDSARMLINLGGLELSEGNLEAAKKHLQTALQKEPDQPLALINLAAVAVRQDDFPAAHELLNRAKEMPLVEANAQELRVVLEHKEKGTTNLIRMRLAARSGPPNWAIEKRYVQLLNQAGAPEAAIAELKHCLISQWYRADSWQLLAELEEKMGRSAEAARAHEKAQQFDVHLSAPPPRA